MAISLDSSINTVQVVSGGVTHDIKEVQVVQGGATSTVWRKAIPYTITTFNKDEWTFSTPNGSGEYDYGVATTEAVNGLWVEAEKTTGNYAFGRLSKTLPTQGCNKLRAKCAVNDSAGGGWANIFGTENTESAHYGKDFYFDISGDSIDFYFQAQSGADGVGCRCTLMELEFYYE